MQAVEANIRSGHIVTDEPVYFPDGYVQEIVPRDTGDELVSEERTALRRATKKSE